VTTVLEYMKTVSSSASIDSADDEKKRGIERKELRHKVERGSCALPTVFPRLTSTACLDSEHNPQNTEHLLLLLKRLR
jgi:hypothetical protein